MATKEMENKLAECEDAVPALFASIGDTFTHATDDRGDAGDIFVYEGRTNEGWLVFKHLEGGGFNQTNGGVRDAIGAWPLSKYSLRLPNGERDLDRIQLHMFRK